MAWLARQLCELLLRLDALREGSQLLDSGTKCHWLWHRLYDLGYAE